MGSLYYLEMRIIVTLLCLLPCILSGPDDTLEQLKVAFTNVHLSDQVTGAGVTVEEGEAPGWIEGSLVRHACGAYGETGSTSDMVNRVGHVFDCIVMGQSYSFHGGGGHILKQVLRLQHGPDLGELRRG